MYISAPKLWLHFALGAALALGSVACNEGEDAQASAAQAEGEGDETEKAGPAAPEGAAPASDDEREREPVDKAIGSDPTTPSGDPCENAYSSMRATIDAMHKRGVSKTKAAMPPKERFMAACAELPEQMQRCMGIRYHMAHQEECKEAADNVDPALKKRVQDLMGKRPGAGDAPAPE